MLKIMVMGIGDIMNDVMNGLFVKNSKENIDFVLIDYGKSAYNSEFPNIIQLETGTRCFAPDYVPAMGELWLNDENNQQKICQYLKNVDLLFIVGNMGGDLGIIGTSELAKLAKEVGIFTISIALKPCKFEGRKRLKYFNQYLTRLQKHSDCTLIVPCQDILQKMPKEQVTRQLLLVEEIADYIGKIIDTFYNMVHYDNVFIPIEAIDFHEIFSKNCYMVSGQGKATGEKAGEIAVNLALQDNPFKRLDIKDTKYCVVYISTKESVFNREQFQLIGNLITDYYGNNSHLCFSVVFDETQQHDIELMIFATSAEYDDSQIES